MPVVGIFKPSKDGGWDGRICTLSVNTRARFMPNDNRRTGNSPDFLITSAGCQIGAAWRRQSTRAGNKPYLAVQMDDPFHPGPILAALFPNDNETSANLVWNPKTDGVAHEQ